MENRTTTWPNIDQYSPVFTTGMPQVDRAETAVKNATGKLVKMMSDVEIGSSSKPVTMMISAPKYTMARVPEQTVGDADTSNALGGFIAFVSALYIG